MPRLVAEGENWLVTERLAGVRPSKPGAWVESLALFVRTFLDPLPASLAGSLSWREPLDVAPLVAVAGVDVVDAIQSSACPGEATRPTHGDLHAGNVLVNAAGELVGVLDFETVALAPPECDVAKWLTVLSAQSGIDAARTATRLAYPLGIDCRVLHDELLRELVIAASTALSREEPAPYCATVRFLAESLAEDATLPARLLGQ
jgi:hypothetical protein